MGLNATLKKAAQSALKATGDLADRVTYVQRTLGAYDAEADTRAVTEVTHTNIPALFCKFQEEDADWYPTNAKGQKLLIAYLDLPIETDDSDYVLIDGAEWNIHKRKSVPGSSMHILFVRQP